MATRAATLRWGATAGLGGKEGLAGQTLQPRIVAPPLDRVNQVSEENKLKLVFGFRPHPPQTLVRVSDKIVESNSP